MKYLFIISLILFIIPVALVIFKAGGKNKKESSTGSQWMVYVYFTIAIVATFVIGISASYYGFDYFNTKYALPLIVNCILTFIVISLILAICGLAISFVVPTTNKNLAYSIVLCSFLCLGLGATIHYYRGDNFNPKTGESLVWITPSTGKCWYNKPKVDPKKSKDHNYFDPKTGEKLRRATKEDFIQRDKGGQQKDFKIYKPGDNLPFELEKGEYFPNHWIHPKREIKYTFFKTSGKFEVHFRGGLKIKICEGEKIPFNFNEDFKIYATEPCLGRVEFSSI